MPSDKTSQIGTAAPHRLKVLWDNECARLKGCGLKCGKPRHSVYAGNVQNALIAAFLAIEDLDERERVARAALLLLDAYGPEDTGGLAPPVDSVEPTIGGASFGGRVPSKPDKDRVNPPIVPKRR